MILVDTAAHRIGYFDRVDHGVVSDDSRRGVEHKSALRIGACKVALAVRSFLIRAEDLLVAVDSTNAVAFRRIISFALLGRLRRVDEDVALLQQIAVELDVDEAVVVVVGVIPARGHVGVALGS